MKNNIIIGSLCALGCETFYGLSYIFTKQATVVSIVAGAVILKESFTLWQIVGAVVIILGVYVANTNEGNAKKQN